MGPFAAQPLLAQLLLESLLVPFVLAVLVMAAGGRFRHRPVARIAPAVALILALGTTYGLVIGWPSILSPSARDKIVLAAVIGLVAGIAIAWRPQWTRPVLVAGAIAIPIWVGLPALQQVRPDSGLLLLPVILAMVSLWLIGREPAATPATGLLLASTLAVGLAAIAAFARALTFTELGLSLAAALIAILITGRQLPLMPAALAASAVLLAMTTALLLYSEASLPAILTLGIAIGADHLARRSTRDSGAEPAIRRVLPFLTLPAAGAIVIARIDAGPISIY